MSATLAKPAGRMTVEEFVAWAERQPEGRFELVDGVAVRMSPERNIHAVVKGNVYRVLQDAVRSAGLPLIVLPDGPTVVIHRHQSRQPDVVVQPQAGLQFDSVYATAPIVLVEVLSPTTMGTDSREKLGEYFSLTSVQHYLLVDASTRSVTHHRRSGEGMIDARTVRMGEIRFDPPGMAVDVAGFFRDLPPGGLN